MLNKVIFISIFHKDLETVLSILSHEIKGREIICTSAGFDI